MGPSDTSTMIEDDGMKPINLDKEKEKSSDQANDSNEMLSERAQVKRWQDRILKAKNGKFEKEFIRMRDNMDYVAGIQWKGQTQINYHKDVINLTLRAVNQGVAVLYAKDPKVKATYRKKLDFAIWEGDVQQIAIAQQIIQIGQMIGKPVPPDIINVMQDYQQGTMKRKMMAKVGKTVETICQYEMDTQQPSFKTQMKQLIRRVNVCGVGYIKVKFVRDYEQGLSQSETVSSILTRAKEVKYLLDKIEKGKIQETDADTQRLKELIEGMTLAPLDYDAVEVKERIEFEFPQATSIIPDPCCRSLKGFVGAKWLVEEFERTIDFVNSFFEVKVEKGGDLKTFGGAGKESDSPTGIGDDKSNSEKVQVWEVTDLETKSTFVICNGWKDYIKKPESLTPTVKGFWQLFPVTFNDVEVEEGCKATIFPPSLVDLVRSTQNQWNETRYRLSRHRRANGPRYPYRDGQILEADLDRIAESEDQEFIKIKTTSPDQKLSDVIEPMKVAPLDPALYETAPLREDMQIAAGQQEANIGPARPHVTATTSSIAEQSRMSVASSDVDGLDDSLSDVFRCAGELIIREFSSQTAKQIAGQGAVLPDQNKDEFINELELDIVASSSGRPNKAIEIANFEKVAPMLMQSGANPHAVIKKAVEVLDADIDPNDFYPIQAAPMPPQQGGEQQKPDKSHRVPMKKKPQGGPQPGQSHPLMGGPVIQQR